MALRSPRPRRRTGKVVGAELAGGDLLEADLLKALGPSQATVRPELRALVDEIRRKRKILDDPRSFAEKSKRHRRDLRTLSLALGKFLATLKAADDFVQTELLEKSWRTSLPEWHLRHDVRQAEGFTVWRHEARALQDRLRVLEHEFKARRPGPYDGTRLELARVVAHTLSKSGIKPSTYDQGPLALGLRWVLREAYGELVLNVKGTLRSAGFGIDRSRKRAI